MCGYGREDGKLMFTQERRGGLRQIKISDLVNNKTKKYEVGDLWDEHQDFF